MGENSVAVGFMRSSRSREISSARLCKRFSQVRWGGNSPLIGAMEAGETGGETAAVEDGADAAAI